MNRAALEQPVDKPWHCLTGDEALQRLGAPANGLTTAKATNTRAIIGPNVIAETKPISPWAIFFAQFKSVLIWILIGASVVSGVLGEATDSFVILAIVFLNAVVGFYQEYSAEKSIAALKQMTAPRAKVWRDGAVTTVASADVVPGDLLELDAGDLVAADARLLSAASLACVEAALTGESEAVGKSIEALDEPELAIGDRANMVYMGTSVATGSGRAVVVATAMQTEMGRIALLIGEAGEEAGTPLQQKLERFGRVLLWATLAIVTLLFGLGLLRKVPIIELFMTSVSLAVAALPESLPAVATAALSLGVLRMSRRRALVRRLASVETLGSTNVICTDKTGTLTVGQMTVRAMVVGGRTYDVAGEGYGPEGEVRLNGEVVEPMRDSALHWMAEILVGCNNAHIERDKDAWSVIGDPTEGALLSAGQKAGGDRDALERESPRLYELPFDSDRKLHSVVRRLPDGRLRVLTNGAPEMLLAKCSHIWRDDGVHPLTDGDREELARQNAHLAGKALRVLGSAFRDFDALPLDRLTQESIERDLVFVGLAGLYDPPRAEAKEAVAKCQAAGIRVVMITGDHPNTAIAIGKELGLAQEGQVATGVDLDKLTDDALQRRVPGVAVYARVSAAHKLRIVRAWQANGAVVAMTGDGVNDAPAIRGADIGVAMGRTGTEVTKQASDMIVTDDNFATIVDAVEEGRGIYENIRKTLQYLLACNASELLLITICIVSGLPTPLLPIHLLWINLVTDGPPALCLAADRVEPGLMSQRPRERDEQLTDERFFWAMLLTAALIAGVAFVAFLQGLQSGGLQVARTNAFCSMVFAQLLISLGARSQTTPIWRLDLFSNLNLLVVVSVSIVVQMWSHINALFSHFLETSQLPYGDGFVLLAAASLPLLGLELVKLAPLAVAKERRGPTPTTRWIGWMTAGVVAATVAGGWLYWPQPRETAAHFVTHAVERGSVVRAVTATGVVRPRPTADVFAPMTGVVQFRDCEVGVKVAKGQLCATIDQWRYRLAVERQRGKLLAARAQLDKRAAELARAKLALERARASAKRSSIDKATSAHERALAKTRRSEELTAQREAALRAAETDLGRTEVRAPMDGTVIFRRVGTGQQVETGKTMLFVIEDHAVAQIEVATVPGDVDKVEIGDRASINVDAAPGRSFDGRATEIRRAQNMVVLSVPDAESLLEPGRTATAWIVIDQRVNVLRAPNEALLYSRSRNVSQISAEGEKPDIMSLWVLRKGKPTPVPVRLGLDDGAHTEIVVSDFEPGDELIVGKKD